MEQWRKDSRKEAVVTDLEALVPKDHLLRKVEKVMDYEWLYEKLDPYYCRDNGRPGIDPVVLIKMALIQHLFGIPSLRQTYRDIIVNLAYRWFLGYGLLEEIPHFSTVSYAFCHRFPEDLTIEIFEHILNKALNNRMVDPRTVFIDGTHIKASANKKKYQKEQVAKAAKVYAEQLRQEVNAEREKLGKKPIEEKDDHDDDDPSGGEMAEKTVSITDPDAGMFIKGEHERQFAYDPFFGNTGFLRFHLQSYPYSPEYTENISLPWIACIPVQVHYKAHHNHMPTDFADSEAFSSLCRPSKWTTDTQNLICHGVISLFTAIRPRSLSVWHTYLPE